MPDETMPAIQYAFERGQATRALHKVGAHEIPIVLDPDSAEISVLDVEKHEPHPRRKRGNATFRTLDSFIQYVKRHEDEGSSVFALADGTFTAVFDHHQPVDQGDEAGWREHTARLVLPQTPGFKAWMAADGVDMPQERFGDFLENRTAEIIEPDGGDLLDLVNFFAINRSVQFQSGRQVSSGTVRLTYVEEDTNAQGQPLDVPTRFQVLLQPYRGYAIQALLDRASTTPPEGTYAFPVEARLRYRLVNRQIQFRFELEEAVQDRLEALWREIALVIGGAVSAPVLFGQDG